MTATIHRRDLVIDGLRLHVAEAGSGPALLLVHGLTASHAVWQPTIEALADRWRVIAPDLPGHGESAKPDAPYTVDFFAGMMRSLARMLDVPEAVVCGSSLGGRVALELALWYPAFTRALVLAAPAVGYSIAMRPVGQALQALTGPRILRASLERFFQQNFHDRTRIGHIARRRILEERLAAPDFPDFTRAVARSLAGVLRSEPQPVERVTQPVLVVWGRQDQLVPLRRSQELMRRIPHARLQVLERCGHLPMLEQPGAFNGAVGEFLRVALAAPRPTRGRVAKVV
ncbi:MAG TPA: alpha/beta fold hydrolase [Candidatus Binatia bacterium]|nr:alpha/beta fold hydrolase [Candidatus Binatia bacterium]